MTTKTKARRRQASAVDRAGKKALPKTSSGIQGLDEITGGGLPSGRPTIGLPGMDGYEVARALRADAKLRSARLIALSGYAQPEDRQRSSAAGFDAHIAKPASIEALEAVLSAPTKDGEHGG